MQLFGNYGSRGKYSNIIEKIVGLTGNLTPIALISPGGIGKMSLALTVGNGVQSRPEYVRNMSGLG